MTIIENYVTKNPCYTAGRKIEVKGLMLHSVGCSQPNASVFVNAFNKESYSSACVHGFIDANDGTVYQTLPWDHRAWHSGGSANNTHIGVEMCEPDCITYVGGASFKVHNIGKATEMIETTYQSAVDLFAMLCQKFNLNPLADGVIISHKEGCARGLASNHGDPEHLWTQMNIPFTMDTFREDVNRQIGKNSEPVTEKKNDVQKFPTVPFLVTVTIPDLNIRSAPSVTSKVRGQTKKGTFTIVDMIGNWGFLKSGAGWIYLGNPDYCIIRSDLKIS